MILPEKTDETPPKQGLTDLDGLTALQGSRPIVIDSAGTLYSLKRTLMQDVGFFEKEFLYRAGVAGAKELFSRTASGGLPSDPRDALELMLGFVRKRGYGNFSVEKLEVEKRIAWFECPDTAEGWSFKHNNNLQREPVCAYAAGVLSHIACLALTGGSDCEIDFAAHEIRCIGAGADKCTFVAGPLKELVRLYPDASLTKDSISEHELRLNEEILMKNLELQSMNLELERQVRKRTEDFWRAEENYDSVVRQSPNPIALITLAGKLTHLNAAGMKMLGFGSEEEVLAASITDILADGEHGWQKIIWGIEKEGRAAGLEMDFVDRSGRRLTGQVFARYADLAPGRCVEAIFKDVTEQKKMEEMVREARSESDFLNDLLSHDIINYTVSALHFLGTVSRTEELNDEVKKKLDVITKDIQGAVDLAISVRDLSRMKAEDRDPTKDVRDLQLLLAEAIEDARTTYFDRNTKFNFQRSTDPRYARASALVSRLFANLISNSIKYDQHETVTIDVTVSEFEDGGVQYWRTEIADRGIGIPDSEKKQVFERFMRGKTKVAGSGLGLFVATSIAKANGGRIWVEDRVEGDSTKGTKMVVILPKADARQIAQARTWKTVSSNG